MELSRQVMVTLVIMMLVEKSVMITEFEKLLEDYDRRVRPGAEGPAVTVDIGVHIFNIPEIRFGKHGMEMTVGMFFSQAWRDNRLQRNSSGMILDDGKAVEHIWVPDTFFSNEHTSLTKEQYVQIFESGEVIWCQRMQVTFTAKGDYRNFPFDSQIFPLMIESVQYFKKDVQFGWIQEEDNSVDYFGNFDGGLTDLNITIGAAQYISCAGLYEEYKQCRVNIKLQVDRISGFYFSILFTPLFLTTILSFSSLWVNINHRLLFILLINLFTIIFKIWFRVSMLPPVSYSVCAIEYIDMCLTITLLVLVEIFFMSLMDISNNQTTSKDAMEFENINLTEVMEGLKILIFLLCS